ncbi:MAG: hypothetical protein MJ189_03500 [Coriobacteriales bacterium]|nr:hypothetical protein [Coriobacteriales bacterium]
MDEKIPHNVICTNNSALNSDEIEAQLNKIKPFELHIRYIDGDIPILKRHVKSLDSFDLMPAMKAHIRSSLEQIVVSDLIKEQSGIITVKYTAAHDIVFSIDEGIYESETYSEQEALCQSSRVVWAYDADEEQIFYLGCIYKAIDTLTLDLLKTLNYDCVLADDDGHIKRILEHSQDAFATSNTYKIVEIDGKCGPIFEKITQCLEKM